MAPKRRNEDGLLARVNFPLYTVQILNSRYVLVGGGGGSSKTGVANGYEIFEIAHDGHKFTVEEVLRHETGPKVVMNCAVYSDHRRNYLVAGQESHCQLYNIQHVVVENEKVKDKENGDVRNRKQTKSDNNRNDKKLHFVIKPMDSVQTDFGDDEPLQRVVRISKSGKLMATGGTDGFVRLWKFPQMEPLMEIKAHGKELDDLDFSPKEDSVVTIAKDGIAVLWSCSTGREIRKFSWAQPEGSKYLYKRCRFGLQEDGENSYLFMLANPTGRAGKQKAYLQQWLPSEGSLNKVAAFDESVSALSVRDDGRFVGVGTMFSGSVFIYIAFSLQKVLQVPGAHSMFVTGLEFLPVTTENHTFTSIAEAAVLSISVDNRVCIHSLSHRSTIPAWLAIIVIIITLFCTFALCSYLGI